MLIIFVITHWNVGINSFTLTEPSEIALERANVNIQYIYQNSNAPDITNIQLKIEDISENNIQIESENITVHLFSNILDVIEPKSFAKIQQLISKYQSGIHYFVCIGCGSKLDWKSAFSSLFEEKIILSEREDYFKRLVFDPRIFKKSPYTITRVEVIFKTNF